jgi:hypothetical protein
MVCIENQDEQYCLFFLSQLWSPDHNMDLQMFTWISDKPVASASLGQVYKATLVDRFGGGTVAVKVQRPGILHSVALDTLLMRQATEIVSRVPMYSGGWEEVLDDWAGRFFQVCCLLMSMLTVCVFDPCNSLIV